MYSDASFGAEAVEGKGTSGFVAFLFGSPVIFSSLTQRVVSLSTYEAETYALSRAAAELLWLRRVALFALPAAAKWKLPALLCDNMSVVETMKSGRKTHRKRHIASATFFVADYADKQYYEVEHCRTKQMVADVLTKPATPVMARSFLPILVHDSRRAVHADP